MNEEQAKIISENITDQIKKAGTYGLIIIEHENGLYYQYSAGGPGLARDVLTAVLYSIKTTLK